ncbi:hypothetical protein FRB95_011981 [Tulasnella sp. JGI-2019a]|nr:hypothetical protein FRB95_011981 [Tulasnella sp. JGI-2019a]
MDTRIGLPQSGAPRLNTPVHRLPEEILLDILLLSLKGGRTSYRYERLSQLMLVCSRWEALSIAPSLWAVVSTEQPLSVIENLLYRSKDALLDVIYTSHASETRSLWPARTETNTFLLNNAHRWRSFEFQQHNQHESIIAPLLDLAFINRLGHIAAPSLNSISLISSTPMSFGTPFPSNITRLRHISVGNCAVPWNPGLFSGLETLELNKLGGIGPSLDQFVNFLHASPGLVTLSLDHWDVQGTLSNRSEIINLQFLERFKIRDIARNVAGHLLTILRIPSCTKLLLRNHHPSDNEFFGQSMEHLFPVLRAIMTSCDNIDITLHGVRLVVVSSKGREKKLEIDWATASAMQDWPIATCEGLRNLLGSTIVIPPVSLRICTDIRTLVAAFILESNGPIEKLTLVHDQYASDRLSRILDLLSKPNDVDGVARWLLPNLKILDIVQDAWTEQGQGQEQLVSMIRNRYADHGPSETYEPPAKLRSLRIISKDLVRYSYWLTMEGILGPGVKSWGVSPNYKVLEDGW